MKIEYEIVEQKHFNNSHRELLAGMLIEQGKVQGNPKSKIDRCKTICIAKIDGKEIGIGAIKCKTASDFSNEKSGLPNLIADFDWELGYLYTSKDYGGRGIASSITRMLMQNYGPANLMASTELTANPGMVKILKNNGFKHFGNPWKSNINDNYLGLFLRLE